MARSITVLGATGSVGEQTLDLVGREPDRWRVHAVTGATGIARLAELAVAHDAEVAITALPECVEALADALAGTAVRAAGPEALEHEAAAAEIAVNGIVGAAGLAPSMAAIRAGRTLALANKETLVAAGELVTAEVARHGATLLPVDSEHSALFQALTGEPRDEVERVVITASGGAFRDWPLERLAAATPADANEHPNWDMGRRITIDSASMFNKALEVVEARELFDLRPGQIEVVVHPESIVHALVGFRDGALMAHLGPHDMRHAIGYALNWPGRRPLPVERLDLSALGSLSFRAPDEERWPALRLAREVMEARGHAGAAFNAAKEVALDAFIEGRIGFQDMAGVVEETLTRLSGRGDITSPVRSLEGALSADQLARDEAARIAAAIGD
ncbi:1-deoxy-D-xylulose 5-phosphate reductoisomerase [Hasllibacter halocynthiae]|uniref:1-deoxy-D-xylulose 5-phosphate reductoisomerase n=1 Tax=Hasllibacter halocynthiae TaxID=595589 RepID=A0A2T0X813_9RHOB|nr:1-deoxy-D-xylulose-5-phosphate reductoisomerase [Hasllibacter halocynthiae]PRY95091.1 1-deoxy-D-xylulose 5-phosphate reductoisomerase [Hasllibacter halocynthiae]